MTNTNGNVIVEFIKEGDIHYEYDMFNYSKLEVITKPEFIDNRWKWVSKNTLTGAHRIFNFKNKKDSPILFDYYAQEGYKQI